ncbi:MAG: serine hydrolase domain-containing protein [Ilumatobacteraceae bacterium]
MTKSDKSNRSASYLAHRAAVTATIAGLLLSGIACSSSDDGAALATTASTTTPARAPTTTTTTPPSTTAPLATSAPPTSVSSDARAAMLTRILASHHNAGEFVGARIALLDRDGTITQVVAGAASADPSGPPVELDTPWGIGSVTKTFVAVVVLQLSEEGRLDLDAGIDAFFPELPGAKQITPRLLLQHTSGLNEYLSDPAVQSDTQRVWTPAELIAVAEAAGRVGEPGGAHHYANTNYIVLGQIIEQVTGNSVADEVRTRVVEPLGLSHTSFISGHVAPGYVVADGTFVVPPPWDPSLGGAAGSMQSNGRDLLMFIKALIDGTLLSPASQTSMRAFVPVGDLTEFGITHSYGLGLEEYSTDTITAIGHLGSGHTHSAFIGYDPATGNAVAVTMNVETPGPQAFMALEALTGTAS